MVGEGFRAVVFAPAGKTLDQSLRMAKDIAGFGGRVLVITNQEPGLSDPGIFVFRLDVRDEYLFAIGSIIPVQFMVNDRATQLGREPGYFTRGAKVTRTE
jgi:glucosamine--fructose-6-phosphate aminotransferase (isomerizing)